MARQSAVPDGPGPLDTRSRLLYHQDKHKANVTKALRSSAGAAAVLDDVMKKLRLGLLFAVALILTAVTWDYFDAQRARLSVRLAEPQEIPSHLDSQATRWTFSQSSGNRRGIEGSAARFRQTKDNGVFELEEVELKIFRENEKQFDLVETPRALFYSREGRLYSEEPVVMTLGLAVDSNTPPARQPTTIHGTGVTFDSKLGTCTTDRFTEYEFENGRGTSIGAFYDSVNRFLHMKSDVYLERTPDTPAGPLVKVRASELLYYERDERVELKGGVSLDLGTQRMESANAVVFLSEGSVQRIEANQAVGSDLQPGRTVVFRSQWFETVYGPGQILERVSGANPAEITSATQSSATTVNGNRIDLHYVPEAQGGESRLKEMYARGQSRIESRSQPGSQGAPADIRRVRSEMIHLVMRENGDDIERVETLAPGDLELQPHDPARPRRLLKANRITAHYAPRNLMETLRANGNVAVESHPAGARAAKGQETLLTWSEELEARFEPDSGELHTLKQWSGFRFERGARHGQSREAQSLPQENRLELTGGARVWDVESNVTAGKIVLNESTGDLAAEGEVATRYQQPSSPPGRQNSGLFTESQPVFATAGRMISLQQQGKVEYRDQARLWQGEDRIEADVITIERQAQNLFAEGNVMSYLRAEQESGTAGKKNEGSRMLISAQAMRYDDAVRRAVYRGGVTLKRGLLTIHSEELEGVFSAQGSESKQRLEKGVARGQVRISQKNPAAAGARQGYGQTAIYEPPAALVRLDGAPARVVDEAGNETRGPQLTYRLNDDRLLVQGNSDGRTYTLRRHRP